MGRGRGRGEEVAAGEEVTEEEVVREEVAGERARVGQKRRGGRRLREREVGRGHAGVRASLRVYGWIISQSSVIKSLPFHNKIK